MPFNNNGHHHRKLLISMAHRVPYIHLGSIVRMLSPRPLLGSRLVNLTQFVRRHAFYPLFRTIHTVLPAKLCVHLHPILQPTTSIPPTMLSALAPGRQRLLDFISHYPTNTSRTAILGHINLRRSTPTLRRLLRLNILIHSRSTFHRMKSTSIHAIHLLSRGSRTRPPGLAMGRRRILSLLRSIKTTSIGRMYCFAKIAPTIIGTLTQGKLMRVCSARILHSPCNRISRAPTIRSIPLDRRRRTTFIRLHSLCSNNGPTTTLLCNIANDNGATICVGLVSGMLSSNHRIVILIPRVSLAPRVVTLFVRGCKHHITILRDNLTVNRHVSR